MKAIRISETGGPGVMKFVEVDVPKPGPGEVRLHHRAIGLNFIDTYHRSGLYPVPLPSGLGLEAAGVVEALGDGVKGLKVGDRVAYGTGALGAYAEVRNYPANRLTKLPKAISDETGAAMMLKGMTVRYLLRATYKVKRGQTILFHAAAGGVGLIFCQWAKALGVKVIGTVGSDEKVEIAKAHGCAHVINSSTDNVVARVREITGGKGVPVVYDSVGKDTFMGSLDCLRPMGIAINYGTASGQVEPFPLQTLHKRSLVVTRPTLGTWIAKRSDLEMASNEFLNLVRGGVIKVDVAARYPLAEVARAHADLEGRRTTGAMVLVP